MKISENIVTEWPNFEDRVVYLIEVKTRTVRPRPFTIFYSTGFHMASWHEDEKAFRLHYVDSLAYQYDVVDVREIKMNMRYVWNTSGDPNMKEWPD